MDQRIAWKLGTHKRCRPPRSYRPAPRPGELVVGSRVEGCNNCADQRTYAR